MQLMTSAADIKRCLLMDCLIYRFTNVYFSIIKTFFLYDSWIAEVSSLKQWSDSYNFNSAMIVSTERKPKYVACQFCKILYDILLRMRQPHAT